VHGKVRSRDGTTARSPPGPVAALSLPSNGDLQVLTPPRSRSSATRTPGRGPTSRAPGRCRPSRRGGAVVARGALDCLGQCRSASQAPTSAVSQEVAQRPTSRHRLIFRSGLRPAGRPCSIAITDAPHRAGRPPGCLEDHRDAGLRARARRLDPTSALRVRAIPTGRRRVSPRPTGCRSPFLLGRRPRPSRPGRPCRADVSEHPRAVSRDPARRSPGRRTAPSRRSRRRRPMHEDEHGSSHQRLSLWELVDRGPCWHEPTKARRRHVSAGRGRHGPRRIRPPRRSARGGDQRPPGGTGRHRRALHWHVAVSSAGSSRVPSTVPESGRAEAAHTTTIEQVAGTRAGRQLLTCSRCSIGPTRNSHHGDRHRSTTTLAAHRRPQRSATQSGRRRGGVLGRPDRRR
jgi:hypothetical protein